MSALAAVAAGLDTEVEAFITRHVPYELGDQRAKVRADGRSLALAHLLGDLVDLIGHNAVTSDAVTAAIRAALALGA